MRLMTDIRVMLMLSAKIHDECYLARIARSWFIVPILDFRLFLIRLGCGGRGRLRVDHDIPSFDAPGLIELVDDATT